MVCILATTYINIVMNLKGLYLIQVLTDLWFSANYYLTKQNVSTCSSYETIVVDRRNLTTSGVQPGNVYYVEMPYFENLENACSSIFFIQG